MIAQIKQRLNYEFPEIAIKDFVISSVRGYTPFLGWLADVDENNRYDKLYSSSIACSLNISISDYTKHHALALIQIEKRISVLTLELDFILKEVFNRFGFGLSSSTLLLLHIYPFESP